MIPSRTRDVIDVYSTIKDHPILCWYLTRHKIEEINDLAQILEDSIQAQQKIC
jgi:hypothetical protein